MKTMLACAVCASLLVVLAPSASAAPAAAAAPASDRAAQPSANRTETFRMPNVVGMILQDAQDLLQSKGSYLMDQVDATGLGRWQVLDSGWKVCWQKPRAGSKVQTSAVITLGSVKLRETCPRR